jgi:hypothetical protein
MQLKALIQGLAAVWLLLFVASFVSVQLTDSDSDAPQAGLARVAAFLTWQLIAFVVAALAAIATRYAVARGAEHVKMIGYVPLTMSVFLVVSFIALMVFRTFISPLFG